MKQLLLISILALFFASCSKEETPQPVATVPNPVTTSSFVYGCDSSQWKYEVIIDTLASDNMDLFYRDGDGLLIPVVIVNSYWTYSFTFNGAAHPPILSINSDPIHNISATITMNIYREGVLVETTGAVSYCNSQATTCPQGTVGSITLQHICI